METKNGKTKYHLAGHAAAAFSALVWGLTFAASKTPTVDLTAQVLILS